MPFSSRFSNNWLKMNKRGRGYYTDDELQVLQRAFDQACADLQISSDNASLREQVAIVMFQLAAAGELDCAALRWQAVRRFRPGMELQPVPMPILALHVIKPAPDRNES